MFRQAQDRETAKQLQARLKRLAVRNTQNEMPRSEPKRGRVLVHNHVMHTVDMYNGENGFRYWTQKASPDLVRCKCGWSGLPHYRVRGLGNGKASTLGAGQRRRKA